MQDLGLEREGLCAHAASYSAHRSLFHTRSERQHGRGARTQGLWFQGILSASPLCCSGLESPGPSDCPASEAELEQPSRLPVWPQLPVFRVQAKYAEYLGEASPGTPLVGGGQCYTHS